LWRMKQDKGLTKKKPGHLQKPVPKKNSKLHLKTAKKKTYTSWMLALIRASRVDENRIANATARGKEDSKPRGFCLQRRGEYVSETRKPAKHQTRKNEKKKHFARRETKGGCKNN